MPSDARFEAITRQDGPSCLIFSRQNLKPQPRGKAEIEGIYRGGYVLAEAAGDDHAIARIHGELDVHEAWSAGRRAEALLRGLGFSDEDANRPVSAFSGGWRIRLNLAQALMRPSDLLLLDEPTEGIQPSIIREMGRTLKKIRDARGLSIVVSEQVLSFALDVADRVIVLAGKPGRIAAELKIDAPRPRRRPARCRLAGIARAGSVGRPAAAISRASR